MTDKWKKLADEWLGELGQLGKEWPSQLQEALREYTDALLREAFDPRRFLELLQRGGASFSGFTGALNETADPYRILGLERSATDEEVKERFRDLVRLLHPDTAGAKGTECFFQMVLAAYNVIKRARGWQ